MKKLQDALNRATDKDIKGFAQELSLKKGNPQNITSFLGTYSGLHSVLSILTKDELAAFYCIYSARSSVTLGDVEKKCSIVSTDLVRITQRLSQLMLIYVIKNRQLLSNKMDKIYRVKEVSENLNITSSEDLNGRFEKLARVLKEPQKHIQAKPSDLNSKEKDLIVYIALNGLFITFEDAMEQLPHNTKDSILRTLIQKKFVNIHHIFSQEFSSIITLSETAGSIIDILAKSEKKGAAPLINNKCYLALNILYTFDSISTYGLFLTKQNKFRVIDKKRISDLMLPIQLPDGTVMKNDDVSEFTLYILYCLKCLRFKKDIAHISLKEIKEEIRELEGFMYLLIHAVNPQDESRELFNSPMLVPSYKVLSQLMHLLLRHSNMDIQHLKTAALAVLLPGGRYDSSESLFSRKDSLSEQIAGAVNYLCMAGLIEIEKNKISLSDIGESSAYSLFLTEKKKSGTKPEKSMYINPDFSLHFSAQEMTTTDIYQLLSHTRIEKHDVLLQAIIDRDSIMQANKRGLSLDRFRSTLESYAKNDIPQNLDFLLQEWSSQTLKVGIEEVILLNTNHSSFIDEILFHTKKKQLIVERISDTWAIVKKEAIDEITRLARKQEAVVSLFENSYDE